MIIVFVGHVFVFEFFVYVRSSDCMVLKNLLIFVVVCHRVISVVEQHFGF